MLMFTKIKWPRGFGSHSPANFLRTKLSDRLDTGCPQARRMHGPPAPQRFACTVFLGWFAC